MDDIRKIIDYFTEIIYLPEPIVSWVGFITVECPSDKDKKERILLRLVTPNYPLMTNIDISFGPQIAALRNTKFSEKIEDLMKTPSSVFMLLQGIQNLITSLYPFDQSVSEDLSRLRMLEEIDEVLLGPQEIAIFSKSSLKEIRLTTKQKSMKLKWNKTWEIVSSDLPSSLNFDVKNKELKTIANKFIEYVELMSKIWEELEEIDLQCYVIDPKTPNPAHLYRRIYFSDTASISIKLNPFNPRACPDIEFLGNEIHANSLKEKFGQHVIEWDHDVSVYDNLLHLLEIEEFPRPENSQQFSQKVFVSKNDCCICFSSESNDGFLPDKICTNSKCGQAFHSECLRKWLKGTCDGVMFGYLRGKCPHCKEDISCSIKK